jgi:O-antigen ligase
MESSAAPLRLSGPGILSALFLLSLVGNRIPIVAGPLALFALTIWAGAAAGRADTLPSAVFWGTSVVAISVISSLFASVPIWQWFTYEFLRRDGKVAVAIAPLLYASVVKHPARTVRQLSALFVGTVAVVAALGGVEYGVRLTNDKLTIGLTERLEGILYFRGFHESHNAAAGLYLVAAMVALGESIRAGWRRRMWGYGFVVCSIGVLLSLSRANIGGLLAILAFVAFTGASKGLRRYLLAVVVCAVVVAIPTNFGRFGEIRNYEQVANIVSRIEYWHRAVDYTVRSPLFGIGFSRFNDFETNGFQGVKYLWEQKRDPLVRTNDEHAHNFVLHVLAETGLVGLAVWLAFLWHMVGALREHLKRSSGETSLSGVAHGLLLALGALLISSLVDVNLTAPATMMPFYFFVGCLAVLAPKDGDGISKRGRGLAVGGMHVRG